MEISKQSIKNMHSKIAILVKSMQYYQFYAVQKQKSKQINGIDISEPK